MGILNRKKELPKHDSKYDKKSEYLGISIREYVTTKPEKIKKLADKMKKTVDNHIKKLKKKKDFELEIMLEDLKRIKGETRENENVWSRWSTAGEKGKILYSEYDRLIKAVKEEIEKRKIS